MSEINELWEDIKTNAVEGFGVLKDELGKLSKQVESQGKILRKKIDLSTIQRKVHQGFTKLGGLVYEHIEDGKETAILTDPDVKAAIEEIKGYKAEVDAIEKEISSIKEHMSDQPEPKEAPKTSTAPKKSTTPKKTTTPKKKPDTDKQETS
ncbi:MAG: hypothetical protein JW885_06625 [Deltaproteobacteria bacterium]|nr:hypothetical protein [Candidatus Zymogenaceae bacterium]